MYRPSPVPVVGNDNKANSRVLMLLTVIACSLLWQGCSAVSQSTVIPRPVPPTTAQTRNIVLPGAIVGSSYEQLLTTVVPVGALRMSQGQLPPGLKLDIVTASISGVPTQAGTFRFPVDRPAEPHGTRSSTNYSLTINAPGSLITVQVSPTAASFAAGEKVQFSALVKNTADTAVSWFASGGTISPNGLWTAPTGTSLKNVTITATSTADPSARSSATATLINLAFRIITGSMPAGKTAKPYSSSLAAMGGQPPYHWILASGSLPAGLSLNSVTGLVSGSPKRAGTYSFSVLSRDASAHTSEHGYSIQNFNPGTNCGPPTYNCSRTDNAVVQIPSQIPNVGNLLGANTVVTDPDFGSRVVRVTDWNTDPAASLANRSYVSATSGSADENLWNTDSTMLILQTMGTTVFPFTFDPLSMQAHRMYVSSNPSHGGLMIAGAGMWSRVSANLLYATGDTDPTISKYDFSDRTNPPSAQLVYDFRTSPNCLPAGFTQTWKTKGGESAGDEVFGMGFSNAGSQGRGVYAAAYKAGSGCTLLNTHTRQAWGAW